MSDQDFLDLTPSRYYALSQRYLEEREYLDFQHGYDRCLLAEVNRNRKKRGKAFVPQDFMVYVEEGASGDKREMTPEEMLHYVKTVIHPALGGK